MRRKPPSRLPPARPRLAFEPLEPRELLAADAGIDWWSSWDAGATDDWSWTFDDSWTDWNDAAGGDATGNAAWDDTWWVEDPAWQEQGDGGVVAWPFDETVDGSPADPGTPLVDGWPVEPIPEPVEPAVTEEGAVTEEVATVVPVSGPDATDGTIPAPRAEATDEADVVIVVDEEEPPVPEPAGSLDDAAAPDEEEVPAGVVAEYVADEVVGQEVAIGDVVGEAVPVEPVPVEDVAVAEETFGDTTVDETWPAEAERTDEPVSSTPVGDEGDSVVEDDAAAVPLLDGRQPPAESPLPQPSFPGMTVGVGVVKTRPSASADRRDAFRSWGAFFAQAFGGSAGAADGVAAEAQSQPQSTTGRPRIRLPFRPFA